MDNQEVVQRISEFCEATFVEVFQNQSCFLYRSDADKSVPSNDRVVIEAIAEEVKIVLALSLPRSILVDSYPIQEEIETLSDDKIADWYLELANRLLGSLKNKVVVGTSTMCLGLPEVKSIEQVKALWEGQIKRESLCFEYNEMLLGCELGVQVTGHIESLEQEEMASVDGELEFF